MLSYPLRLFRMVSMLVAGRIGWPSFVQSLRPGQRAVVLVGGGMVYCDRQDERDFFAEP
ncbi:hypothetical protein [Cupriavidus sp. L7L]|uniref:hypothetical protein n=1 Tax=Cupriavidus sp. L7L TaxID=2546443 RepID=UPI001404C9C7|nr:hypothetical protein [Cupriavidus sp. L7L]